MAMPTLGVQYSRASLTERFNNAFSFFLGTSCFNYFLCCKMPKSGKLYNHPCQPSSRITLVPMSVRSKKHKMPGLEAKGK